MEPDRLLVAPSHLEKPDANSKPRRDLSVRFLQHAGAVGRPHSEEQRAEPHQLNRHPRGARPARILVRLLLRYR